MIAQSSRSTAREAAEKASAFMFQVNEHTNRTQDALDRIEGGTRLVPDQQGSVSRNQVANFFQLPVVTIILVHWLTYEIELVFRYFSYFCP